MGSDCDESERTISANNNTQDSASTEPPPTDGGAGVGQPADANTEVRQHSGPPTPEPLPSPENLIMSGQYLVDYTSWLTFVGEDQRMNYSTHLVSRNDKIWELISTEFRFLDLLLVIRDVFLKAFPPKRYDSVDLAENLFPHIEVLLDAHSRLFYYMLKEHTARPDRIITNLGRCFIKVLTEERMNKLVEAYGALMFVQSSLSDRLGRLKADPAFAERLSACERDPRTKRRTVTDCYMIILQRWSKIETLLSGIISDTIVQDDSTELDDLNASRKAAQNLLLGAQQNMTDLVHAEKLRYFADNLLEDWVDIGDGETNPRTLIEWMKAPDAKLINCDKLTVQRGKEGGKPYNIELYGVALKDCFFLLRQDPETGKFSIYRDTNMPPILIWTKHFGYFREQDRAPLTFIIIMDSNNTTPTLDKFVCATYDEVARWQKVFTDGFDNFGKVTEPELETLLQKNTRELEFAEERRKRQEEKLELINELTTDIFAQWEARNIAFRTLFVGDGLTASTSRSNSSRSTNRDPVFCTRSITSQSDLQQSEDEQTRVRILHDRFMKSVMRLASICGEVDFTDLSRSASDAADRRLSCSSAIPPTPDSVSAFDGPKKKSDKESFTLRIKNRGFHLRSSRRRSVGSQNRFSNILRTGSRRRGDGASIIASPTDFQRDDWTPGIYQSDGASESSLPTLSNPSALIADIQELARSLQENYDNQYIHCLEMEKDIVRLKAEVDIAGGQTSINAKRELEYLRSLQKKTECEQKTWNAHKQKEDARLEREDQKLKNLAKELAEKQQHCEEDRRTLQELIDLYASRGLDMSRFKDHGSLCSLHFTPQTPIQATCVPLTQSQSLRNEARPLPTRNVESYKVKVPKNNLPAPVTKELEDRLQRPDSTGPQGTNTSRVGSNESLNGLYPRNAPTPRNHEFENTGGAAANTARPPAGPRTKGELANTSGVTATNSTLGDLPAKLASKSQSKSRNIKRFIRH